MESFKPLNIEEAFDILSVKDAIIVAGGTDAMVKRRTEPGIVPEFENDVVFINGIRELKNINSDENYIYIGAGCTYTEAAENELIPDCFRTVIADIATPAIRNAGTLGGNVCNASPAADILPLLYALEAKLLIESKSGNRTIPIEDFIVGPGRTDLKKGEILTCIKIPLKEYNLFYYKKVGTRKAAAVSKISFAGFANVKTGKIKEFHAAFGSVGPTTVRVKKAEEEIKEMNIDEALQLYGNSINPIDDQRSTAIYRKKVSMNLLKDFIGKVEEKYNG
ncbi:FAD binding domain-containing protein [Clostridium tyrobutyricum]|uniref:FAD binding domain-containing protein n=1 Tax=Clostridium tyrobutyricum TaxID=1519 RepID=UPI002011D73B|nr:FAD binding domain-containing protein [Clostridium tyrobutyricum]MBR9647203.1 FAD binding domain-containing protein [Clostridium tyrobutyricum]